jgi:hypothetical protein
MDGGDHDLRIAPLGRHPSDRPAYFPFSSATRPTCGTRCARTCGAPVMRTPASGLILALVALRYVDEARYGFFDFDGVHVSGIRLSFFLGFRPEAIFHLFSHNQR